MARRMLSDESVHAFATDIRRKCLRLRKSPAEMMERFVHNLRDDLSLFVLERDPTNFDEAVRLASKAEALQKYRHTRTATTAAITTPDYTPQTHTDTAIITAINALTQKMTPWVPRPPTLAITHDSNNTSNLRHQHTHGMNERILFVRTAIGPATHRANVPDASMGDRRLKFAHIAIFADT